MFITRGSYVHKPVVKFSGASQFLLLLQFSQNIDGFRNSDKMIHKACTIHKTVFFYKQNPIMRIFFIFGIIYQNYTLALIGVVELNKNESV